MKLGIIIETKGIRKILERHEVRRDREEDRT